MVRIGQSREVTAPWWIAPDVTIVVTRLDNQS